MLHQIARALLICLLPLAQAQAQSIVLNPDEVFAALRDHKVSDETFYVNGPYTEGLSEAQKNGYYPLGRMGELLLALTALRLADEGLIDLDRPVARDLPDVIDENPFNVAVTPRHLLSSTAGFAVPPEPYLSHPAAHVPFRNYALEIRTPGQAPSFDPVGWRMLARLMEKAAGAPLMDIVANRLLTPLGFDAAALQQPTAANSYSEIYDLNARGGLIAELARLLIQNRDATGQPFLSTASHDGLTHPSLHIHPLAPAPTIGATRWLDDRLIWLVAGGRDEPGPRIIAFPHEGAAFVNLIAPDTQPLPAYHGEFERAVIAFSKASFPPNPATDANVQRAATLRQPDTLGGRYVHVRTDSPWLIGRLGAARYSTVIKESTPPPGLGDAVPPLEINSFFGGTDLFANTGPYSYKSDDENLFFSPDGYGGYAMLGGTLYRHVGILGDPRFVLSPAPYVFLIMLSSILHIRSRTGKAWRRMAVFGFVGTLMVAGGIYCELTLWPDMVYGSDRIWLITLWRTLMNIGLMLVLSVPLFATSFRRRGLMPDRGLALLFAVPHLALLSLSAVGILWLLTAWGLAGSFTGP